MKLKKLAMAAIILLAAMLVLSACKNGDQSQSSNETSENQSAVSQSESISEQSPIEGVTSEQNEISEVSENDTSDNQKGESDTIISPIEDNSQIEKGTAASNDKPDSASEITEDESTINLADFKAKLDLTDFGELDDDTLEKLSRLRPNMTSSEVYEVLGEADEHAPTGIAWDYFYINGNKNRWIKVGYFGDTIDVQIGDADLHKGFDLFERLYGLSDQ